MGQSQVPFALSNYLRYWPLGRDIRKWRTLLTLRTNSGSLPGLCGFLYPFHQFRGIAAFRVHSAFKDKRTSTFSNKSSHGKRCLFLSSQTIPRTVKLHNCELPLTLRSRLALFFLVWNYRTNSESFLKTKQNKTALYIIEFLSTHLDQLCQLATSFGITNRILKCQICQENLRSDELNFLLCFMEIKEMKLVLGHRIMKILELEEILVNHLF